jgi:hypothetical protein
MANRIRKNVMLHPDVIDAGKKKADKKGLSFSRWLELLIKNSK